MKWSRGPGGAEAGRGPAALRLDLEVTAGRLRAALHGSDHAATRAVRAFDRAAAERLATTIGAILNRATRWGDADQGSRELLRQHGELLFDAVLPASIKAALRRVAGRSPAAALSVVADPALLGLPWELMHTGSAFLGLGFAVGRIARGLQAETSVPRSASPRRALVVCDPRGDLIGSYYEGLTLRDRLGEHLDADLRSSEVKLDEVRRLLREYDIVHFAGHAERAANDGEGAERGWWLDDGVLGPGAIRELAGGRAFPRLIFSNACRSAGEGIALRAGTAGIAAAFLEAGVEHYIGTVHDVPDEPASLFALTFYEALVGSPATGIGEAMRAAREVVAERYGSESIYWASWVLYGQPATPWLEVTRIAPLEIAAPAVAVGLPPLGARTRGVAAAPALVVAGQPPTWQRLARLASLVFSLFGVAAAVAMGALLLGRSPPTAWTDGRALARVAAPAPVRIEATPNAVRFAVPYSGFVALWRARDNGAIERVMGLREADAGELVEVPMTSGAEWFYLGWRQVPPSDPRAFESELATEMSSFGSTEDVRDRFREALDDQFDAVTELLVGPR